MTGVQDFQRFIETDSQLQQFGSCVQTVNLLRLDSRAVHARSPMMQTRLALVMDGEHCLDRLYGGYYSDWSCGGQWRNMIEYLATVLGTLGQSNVHLAIFFNGGLEPTRFRTWVSQQLKTKENVKNVFRHLHKRATPPPKAWWTPPTALQTALRMALRTLNCNVLSSIEDHHHEVMTFCWENGYHGVMSDDAEYAIFGPPRYFSAHSLKLTLQYEVLTREFVIDEVAKCLDLNPNRFCLLGALLGNHILPPAELKDFHEKLAPELKQPKYKIGFERVIRAVVNYIRTLPTIDDFEAIGNDVFGSAKDPRIKKLRESVKYYQVASHDGYMKMKPRNNKRKKPETIKLASETEQQSSKNAANDLVERIALDLDKLDLSEAVAAANKAMAEQTCSKPGASGDAAAKDGTEENEKEMSVITALAKGVDVEPSEEGKYPVKVEKPLEIKPISIPDVQTEVLRTAAERHRQGFMSPLIYQLLTRGEIKLPALMEDENSTEIPAVHHVYQSLRQNVYAVLFNMHHQKFNRKQAEENAKVLRRKADEMRKLAKSDSKSKEEKQELQSKADSLQRQASEAKVPPKPEIRVREWLPYNNYATPQMVEAMDITWPVPTVQRLWFGPSLEDKQKRLRAFLSCLRCDEVKPLLSHTNVPQHMLLLACVLRYIMASPSFPVLRKPELDAFLATAFSPEMGDPRYLSDMRLDMVTPRGVQLATLFMQGIEMALMANDACGAPIPFQMSLPWTYFDGKLFHSKLRRATTARNLMDLCDGRLEIVCQVERMRGAILHGIVPQYAAPPFGNPPMAPPPMGRGRGMVARGGQLIVGGAVVGQWGANFGSQRRGQNNAPQGGKKKNKKGKNKKPNDKANTSKDSTASAENGGTDAPSENGTAEELTTAGTNEE